jgi:hypothetical protein
VEVEETLPVGAHQDRGVPVAHGVIDQQEQLGAADAHGRADHDLLPPQRRQHLDHDRASERRDEQGQILRGQRAQEIDVEVVLVHRG